MQMHARAASLARSLGRPRRGSGALTSFAGAKSIGVYGTRGAEAAVPAGDRRAASCASRSASPSPAAAPTCSGRCAPFAPQVDGGWVDQRQQDLVHPRRTSPTTSCCSRAPTATSRSATRACRCSCCRPSAEGVTIAAIAKLGMRAHGLLRRRHRRRVRARRSGARRAGQGVVHAAADAQQRAHHGGASFCCGILDGVLEDALAYMKRAQGVRPHDRPVPDPPALHRRHRDLAPAGRADAVPRRVAADQGPPCSSGDDHAEDRRLRSTRSRPPISASRSSAAWATRPRPTCSATGATRACCRIGPITNEMARNVIAEQLGLPRSF